MRMGGEKKNKELATVEKLSWSQNVSEQLSIQTTLAIQFRLGLESFSKNRKQIEVAAGHMIKERIHTFLTLKLMTLAQTEPTNGRTNEQEKFSG